MTTVHIGAGAGFSGDRFDAALPVVAELARRDGPRYLIYEVLAERTLAIAQGLRRADPEAGYSPYLDHYLRPALQGAVAAGVRIVTNMGAANPAGAARRVHAIAREQGLRPLRVAVVTGDDLLGYMTPAQVTAYPTMEGLEAEGREPIAANAYLGARPVARALALDPDVVLVGRTTDSALVLGPLIHEFGWAEDDLDRLAAGTICGHLLECGAQVSGAYFADPGFKDVPDLARVGFPVAEVRADGAMVIGKPGGTGGCVTRATVTEQLLYEMHDPAAYLVPDVTADITRVRLDEDGDDRIRVVGVRGHAPPGTLKATVCFDNGWLGEAEMSYAGPNALARARLALSVVRDRMAMAGLNAPLRCEVLGTGAVHGAGLSSDAPIVADPASGEYRARVAAMTPRRETAQMVVDEMQSLYCSGPAGGGGYRCHVTAQVATASVLLPADAVMPHVRAELVSPS